MTVTDRLDELMLQVQKLSQSAHGLSLENKLRLSNALLDLSDEIVRRPD